MSSLKDILNLPPQAAEIEFGLAAESMEKALGAARPLLRWCNAHEKSLESNFYIGGACLCITSTKNYPLFI